jgi:2-amino-4-hydroxy-6-hydroxymethyldihydropteridine diphosphokinase
MRLLAYIGIGSNLGDPVVQVREAIEALGDLPDSILVARSSLYRGKPMGPPEQPDYVNAVIALDTVLSPEALLVALQAIEQRLGRDRSAEEKWGPRLLDLDLLLYGSREIRSVELTIPHPGMHERDFVLIPLAEIAGDITIPGRGTLSAFLSRCENHSLRRLVVA